MLDSSLPRAKRLRRELTGMPLKKGIRDLDRQLNAGGVKLVLKWTGPETAKSEFQPLLDEFTTRTLDS